ncbi:hypothetical protein H0H93_011744 [Arthromyces matolae]|nr:hypothetical protein H0H93_011744 [Arthromyces matolae]
MKRSASEQVSSSKRIKLHHSIFEDSKQRNPHDVLETGLEDDSGYLSCKCFMTWKPTSRKHTAIIETLGSTPRARFEVEFSGQCVQFFHQIQLKAQDEFLLALKSAQIEAKKHSSVSCNIPLKLVYDEGVIIKFVKRQGPLQVVDTWQLTEEARRLEDSWFLSPGKSTNLPGNQGVQCTDLASPIKHISTSTESHSLPASAEVLTVPTVSEPPNGDVIPPNNTKTHTISKTQRKMEYRRRRLALKHGSTSAKDTRSITISDAQHNSHITDPNQVAVSTLATVPAPEHKLASISTAKNMASTSTSPPSLTAGVYTPKGRYHSFEESDKVVKGDLFNVIGVVVQANLTRTTNTGDLSCSFKLVDPSNTNIQNLSGQEGFRVNCFTQKYEQWLPQPRLGEILILRHLKILPYHDGIMGVGYKDRLQWAIFSPSNGKIRHGDMGDAPESEGLQEGFGHPYSPFFHPEEAEIRYCLKLADWWAETEKHRNAEVHQIGGSNDPSMSVTSRARAQRLHRLIKEAGPDVEPRGFFDCTVEILYGHMNDNGVYSLYVTDYTINTSVAPVEASWCLPGLGDYVLKIEAWDEAVAMAQAMFAGEYYCIKNARMTLSRGGYAEGKVNQDKIRRLEKEDADLNNHLKALLERKRQWLEAHQSENSNDFKYETISEAIEAKHFHCVVEVCYDSSAEKAASSLSIKVLHAFYDGNGTSCLYVTDYTARNELNSTFTRGQETWGAGLSGFILRIALFNNQAEMAKSVEVGSFYDIKKLRLKQSATSKQFQGHLGGTERLISLLNPTFPDEKLIALKKRKEDWQSSLGSRSSVLVASIPQPLSSQPNISNRPHQSIAEILAKTKLPTKSRISARVVDFRPWKLSEIVNLHYILSLPPVQKACFNCDDTDFEYVRYMYQMYILLEDAAGDQLYSSVFDNLKRADVGSDSKSLNELSEHLFPLLGDLLKLHLEPVPKEGTTLQLPQTPLRTLVIDTWEVDGKHAHSLAELEES